MKKVLAEDYTGHLCGNCPYAGFLLNDTLKSLFGNQLVTIGVHAGFFAETCPTGASCPGNAPAGSFTTDFTNATSTAWDNFFGISNVGNPNGMIDRKDFPTLQHIKSPGSWSTQIQQEAALSPVIKMRIINHFNAATRTLETAIQSKFISNLSDTFKLQVVITEDSVMDWQEWYLPHLPQFDSTYAHRHVLRDAVNGSFGNILVTGSVSANTIGLAGYSYTLNSAWNASHCKVVAFIYEASTRKILQVEEAEVTQ